MFRKDFSFFFFVKKEKILFFKIKRMRSHYLSIISYHPNIPKAREVVHACLLPGETRLSWKGLTWERYLEFVSIEK